MPFGERDLAKIDAVKRSRDFVCFDRSRERHGGVVARGWQVAFPKGRLAKSTVHDPQARISMQRLRQRKILMCEAPCCHIVPVMASAAATLMAHARSGVGGAPVWRASSRANHSRPSTIWPVDQK